MPVNVLNLLFKILYRLKKFQLSGLLEPIPLSLSITSSSLLNEPVTSVDYQNNIVSFTPQIIETGTSVDQQLYTYAPGSSTVTETGTANDSQFNNYVTAPQLISNVSTGTAPLVVTSTTLVANLNVANASYATYVFADDLNLTPFGNRLLADYIYNYNFYRAGWR